MRQAVCYAACGQKARPDAVLDDREQSSTLLWRSSTAVSHEVASDTALDDHHPSSTLQPAARLREAGVATLMVDTEQGAVDSTCLRLADLLANTLALAVRL